MGVHVAGRETELDVREVRVLGCLIEKELSTPEYYPMTVNALTSACNQKTNRHPVVDYSESDVLETLEGLQRKRLVGSASSSHGRAPKFRHALREVLGLEGPHLAVLASMLLRGPETPGEIRGRSGRMHSFDALESVDSILEELSAGEAPLVMELPLRPGQKEVRYTHLFGGVPDRGAEAEMADPGDLAARVDDLEDEVAEIRAALTDLAASFRSFKELFE